ncbi:hypothetical protein LCGC14_1169750 [marine sediment metagenome]|uniref:Uncharacterized protein n=1 Tax=marine sediment metagenome TaxID=412755 RepID=A0A0F9PVR9_9ZZZZ
MNESGFWRKIRNGIKNPPDTHLVRIENAIYSGTPDLSYCINGVEGFIELKYLEAWPKRESTVVRIPHFRGEQRIWLHDRHIAGGRCYLCLGIAKSTFIFDGLQAAMFLGKDWNKADIYSHSLLWWDGKVAWKNFKNRITK